MNNSIHITIDLDTSSYRLISPNPDHHTIHVEVENTTSPQLLFAAASLNALCKLFWSATPNQNPKTLETFEITYNQDFDFFPENLEILLEAKIFKQTKLGNELRNSLNWLLEIFDLHGISYKYHLVPEGEIKEPQLPPFVAFNPMSLYNWTIENSFQLEPSTPHCIRISIKPNLFNHAFGPMKTYWQTALNILTFCNDSKKTIHPYHLKTALKRFSSAPQSLFHDLKDAALKHPYFINIPHALNYSDISSIVLYNTGVSDDKSWKTQLQKYTQTVEIEFHADEKNNQFVVKAPITNTSHNFIYGQLPLSNKNSTASMAAIIIALYQVFWTQKAYTHLTLKVPKDFPITNQQLETWLYQKFTPLSRSETHKFSGRLRSIMLQLGRLLDQQKITLSLDYTDDLSNLTTTTMNPMSDNNPNDNFEFIDNLKPQIKPIIDLSNEKMDMVTSGQIYWGLTDAITLDLNQFISFTQSLNCILDPEELQNLKFSCMKLQRHAYLMTATEGVPYEKAFNEMIQLFKA